MSSQVDITRLTTAKSAEPAAGDSALESFKVDDDSIGVVWNRRLVTFLAVAVATVIVAGIVVHVLHFGVGLTSRETFGFTLLFDLNEEANVPTWLSSMMLAGCSVFLGLIALAKHASRDRWVWYWAALGAMFLMMSLDEIATIHERSSRLVHNIAQLGPIFTNAWVLIAIPLLVVLFLVYARFLLSLPRRTMWKFLLAGMIYITGAAGVELLSGLVRYKFGTFDIRFAIVTTVEESLEMLGVWIFLYALTDYMRREGIVWHLTAGDRGGR